VTIVVSPNQSAIQTQLRAFLLQILPAGVEVISAQVNRVPEPEGDDFVIMTPLLRTRLATNEDEFSDALFTASITSNILDVTVVTLGSLIVGSPIFGENVAANTMITSLGSGTGGVGTYNVSTTPDVTSEAMAGGTSVIGQETQITMQIDVHGPNASDNAQIISTLFRDPYAVDFFNAQTPAYGISPLYTTDPRQTPFINAEQQYEYRYTIDAELQVTQGVVVPQQSAGAINVGIVSVEAAYPE
jgi:hypothetical protein